MVASPLALALLCLLPQAQEARLTVTGASRDSLFGYGTAVSGDWALVGAFFDSLQAPDAGSAFLFERTPAGWLERQRLTAPNPRAGEFFGHPVALSGDVAVVAATDRPPAGGGAGKCYVFRRGTTSWSLEATLVPPSRGPDDWFGSSVAVEGDWIAVGAEWTGASQSLPQNAGVVWMYHYNGQSWVQAQRLTASDLQAGDQFGAAVAMSNGTLLVGADGKSNGPVWGVGAVYAFESAGGGAWVETQKILALNNQDQSFFGRALDISGDWAVVGAPNKKAQGVWSAGAGFFFHRVGGVWVQDGAELTSPWAAVNGHFGDAVAISGSLALFFSGTRDIAGTGLGAVHPYRLEAGTWIAEPAFRPADMDPRASFGWSMDLDGNRALIAGDSFDPPPAALGAAYVFDMTPTPSLMASPLPLVSNEDASITLRHGTPSSMSWLAYSTTGPGATPVPALGVVLDLAAPRQLLTPRLADPTGFAEWQVTPVPAGAQGVQVWLQAAQAGVVTNLIYDQVQ